MLPNAKLGKKFEDLHVGISQPWKLLLARGKKQPESAEVRELKLVFMRTEASHSHAQNF